MEKLITSFAVPQLYLDIGIDKLIGLFETTFSLIYQQVRDAGDVLVTWYNSVSQHMELYLETDSPPETLVAMVRDYFHSVQWTS